MTDGWKVTSYRGIGSQEQGCNDVGLVRPRTGACLTP